MTDSDIPARFSANALLSQAIKIPALPSRVHGGESLTLFDMGTLMSFTNLCPNAGSAKHFLNQLSDNLAGMMCKCRWLAISVALGLTGLACARTTMPNIDASEGGTSGATGGTTSAGGTTTAGGTPPSCSGLAATCGPLGNEDCCTSLRVPGGTFYRGYDGVDFTDKSFPATVADFYLDKYEITVGRFRAFVNAGMGTQANPPAPGAGANPLITGSGWDSRWNTKLLADTPGLISAMKCDSDYQTWTDTAGSNESQPQNCLDWYTAFAFCAWDGGRLPTEAEWNYAASGGSEQRYYPWSIPPTSTTIDDSFAVYCGGSCNSIQKVGSKSPKGDGKWGQADLAGNVGEWILDWYWYTDVYPTPCNNCADLATPSGSAASGRVLRGGGDGSYASNLRSCDRMETDPWQRGSGFGSRCARTSP